MENLGSLYEVILFKQFVVRNNMDIRGNCRQGNQLRDANVMNLMNILIHVLNYKQVCGLSTK